MKRRLVITSLLLTTWVHLASAASPAWRIAAINLEPDSETGRGKLTATLERQAGGERAVVSGSVPLERIDSSFVTGDKFVVLGESHRPQAVVVFDIRLGIPIDWFFCYSPRRVSERWVAYVEFYFPHVAGGEPTDVVLVYDLQKSPLENRLKKVLGMTLPPGDLDSAAVEVGVPVYPPWNATRKSYSNVVTDLTARRGILGQGGYALVGASKLVFLVAEGGEAFLDERNHLEVVDLSDGLNNATSRRIEIPKHRFRRPGANPSLTTVNRLEAAGPTAVRLHVPENEYGVDSITVEIPQ